MTTRYQRFGLSGSRGVALPCGCRRTANSAFRVYCCVRHKLEPFEGYRGRRSADNVALDLYKPDGQPLDPRLDLWPHSPTGFNAGYGGSGPAQAALAILADYFGRLNLDHSNELAVRHHQAFKFAYLAAPARAGGFDLTLVELRDLCLGIGVEALPFVGASGV